MSKMFDALRRAEAERRRKSDSVDAPIPIAPERVDKRLSEAPARAERREPAVPLIPGGDEPYRPVANGSDPFPGDMLREMGILHNSVEARLETPGRSVLAFTSALHGEGASTVALAYARLETMHGGRRVLLVELNARTPSLARRLNLTNPAGVTDYFEHGRPLAELVQRPEHERFDVVHVGAAQPALIQVNLLKAFPRMLDEARRVYDSIIIDAPPVVVCPETPPIAPLVDGVVIVVQCGRTKRETVKQSIAQIAQFKGRVVGVVLNRKRYYIPEFIYKRL